ncbi:alpha/beta hydrolase [Nocardioides immobilis]|uniref:Alpha/beta hydrolase n=1 Tax=Nocardioides immobilis TaxID=2049295 RepID=A0A417XXT9_9ACTN|nr:alpha/beta hydrolase [Nocardioides immobilis]RHW25060.1 alpha/beta hydrolase [Nocardioides immobilis]
MTHAYDHELAPWAPAFAELSFADIPAARAGEAELVAALPPYDPPVPLDVHELLVPGPEGGPAVRVRRYQPADHDGPLPALVYLHGGGFVVGSLDLYDADCRRISAEVGAVVFSVDYRLAPEHPFPAGLEDCYATLVWVAENAGELGVDPERIAVGGESAGGGLAAGVALLARDRGGPRLCLQFLGIPEIDDRLETESMRNLGEGTPITTRANGEISWDSYLGAGVRGTDLVSPYAAPARATDLAGLPPALVTAYEFDALRDEGIAYAQQLLWFGVPTELHVYPGAFHACTWLSHTAICQKILGDLVDALRRRLHAAVPEAV